MIESELFFGSLKKALEFWVRQERDWNNVSTSVFSDVNWEVTLWDV